MDTALSSPLHDDPYGGDDRDGDDSAGYHLWLSAIHCDAMPTSTILDKARGPLIHQPLNNVVENSSCTGSSLHVILRDIAGMHDFYDNPAGAILIHRQDLPALLIN